MALLLSLQMKNDKEKEKDFTVLMYLYYVSDNNFVNFSLVTPHKQFVSQVLADNNMS